MTRWKQTFKIAGSWRRQNMVMNEYYEKTGGVYEWQRFVRGAAYCAEFQRVRWSKEQAQCASN